MKKSPLVPIILLALAAIAIGAVIVYQYTRPPGPVGVNKKIDAPKMQLVYLENGLDMKDRAVFYHLAEGSEVYPLTWMKALETVDGKPFLDDVERMGFLPDPENKDGLPVGLTSGITIGMEPLGPMVGLTCAACHVGELHYKDKRIRIDGAPNLLNTREFFKTLIDAALATAEDPAKLVAFLVRVKNLDDNTEPTSIRAQVRHLLVAVVKKEDEVFHAALKPVIRKIMDDEAAAPRFHFKAMLKAGVRDEKAFRAKVVKDLKLDGVAQLLKKSTVLQKLTDEVEQNSVLTHTLEDIYISIRLLRARAAFLKKLGPVGDNPRTNWGAGRVDAFGSARTFLFDDKYEPINPVSYPPIFELKSHGWFHYDNNTNTLLERNFGQALGVGAVYDAGPPINTTLQVKNLLALEGFAAKLSAPKWREDLLGNIDQERAKRGETLYMKYCAACHNPPKEGEAFVQFFGLDEIKTDPERALMFAEKLPDGTPLPDAIRTTMLAIKIKEIANFSPAEKAALEKQPVDRRGPAKYAARTIKGSWATAPYLHNGSVPTLDDLLQPAKDRPAKFYVGSHQYDAAKLGYVSDDKTTLFDTSIHGNSNAGHEGEKYGTNISPAERKDLLEYLKTQ